MKKFLFSLFFILSFTAQAQDFILTKSMKYPRDMKINKHNHLLILGKYRAQIDSEIKRLVSGLEYETPRKESALQIPHYQNLLVNLLIKRIFVQSLESQLVATDLNKVCYNDPRKKVFNTDNIKIDLAKEMNVHLDQVLDEKNIGHYFLKDLKTNLIKETVKTVAVKTYQSVGSGLLAKLVTTGVTQAALKSTVMSLGSKIFVSAGTASILSILTFPLHGYRLPPETVWTDILEKNPELILNPEWMKYAGSVDDPWFTHDYAVQRRTDNMKRALKKFIQSEESSFQSKVTSISKIREFKPEPKTPKHDDFMRAKVDGTYVHKHYIIMDFAPFWAAKR